MEKIKHSLELDEDMSLFKKGWKIHIIAWVVFYVLIFFAAIGLFGTGPLSYSEVSNEGGRIKYERFLRDEAETEVIITADNVVDAVHLALPQDYLDYIGIVRFNPEPQTRELLNHTVVYTFPATGIARVSMLVKPKMPGRLTTDIMVNGRKFALSHIIYP